MEAAPDQLALGSLPRCPLPSSAKMAPNYQAPSAVAVVVWTHQASSWDALPGLLPASLQPQSRRHAAAVAASPSACCPGQLRWAPHAPPLRCAWSPPQSRLPGTLLRAGATSVSTQDWSKICAAAVQAEDVVPAPKAAPEAAEGRRSSRRRRMAQLSPKVKVEGATAADADEVGGAEEEEVEEEEDAPAPKKKSKGGGRKREQDPLPLKGEG